MKRVLMALLALVLISNLSVQADYQPMDAPEQELVIVEEGTVQVDVDFGTRTIAVIADMVLGNRGKTLTQLALHLNPDFKDIKVSIEGEDRPFQRLGSRLLVPCGTLAKGESLRVTLEYSGTINDYDPVHRRTWNGITENCVYANAYYWLPITRSGSYPRGELTVRVPRGAQPVIVGNSQYHSSEKWEVWTYKAETWYPFLLAGYYDLHQTKYEQISLRVWTFRDGKERAQQYLSEARRALDFYGEHFGNYDWTILAIAEIPNQHGGGQALSPLFVLVPEVTEISWNNNKQRLQAHELAHHWWGRRAWMSGPENVWSREAFATYSASLYLGHVNGVEALLTDLATYERQYWQQIAVHPDMPIVQATREQPHYHQIVYEKGALVLRMLHYLLGDEAFFELMQYYYQMGRSHDPTFQFSREHFQQKAEELYGSELDWFFNQWLQSTAQLDIELSDVQVNETNGKFVVTATLENRGDATMPFVEVGVKTATGFRYQRVPLGNGTLQSVRFESADPVYELEVDPKHWLLLPDRDKLAVSLSAGGLLRQYQLRVRPEGTPSVLNASFQYVNASSQAVEKIALHLPAESEDIQLEVAGEMHPYVTRRLADGELELVIDLAAKLPPGQMVNITIKYTLAAKEFGLDGSPWYPHLSHKSAVPMTVTVEALSGVSAFGAGKRVDAADAVTLINEHETVPLLVIDNSSSWSHTAALDGRLNVYYSDPGAEDMAQKLAAQLVNMEAVFGPYPYTCLNVIIGAETDCSQPGTVVSAHMDLKELTADLVRQWWGHYLRGSGLADRFINSVASYAAEVCWAEDHDLLQHERWPDNSFSPQHRASYLQWMLINGVPGYPQFLRTLLAEHGGTIIDDDTLLSVWPNYTTSTGDVLQQWLGSDRVPNLGAVAIVADRVYYNNGKEMRVITVLNSGELLLPAAGIILNGKQSVGAFEGRVAHVVFANQGAEGSPQLAATWMPHDKLKSLWLKYVQTNILCYPGIIVSLLLLLAVLVYLIVMRRIDRAIDEKEFDFSQIL